MDNNKDIWPNNVSIFIIFGENIIIPSPVSYITHLYNTHIRMSYTKMGLFDITKAMGFMYYD